MRDDIQVETDYQPAKDPSVAHSATITDRKAGRAWGGEGPSVAHATTDAMKKFLGDRRAREYVGD